MQQANKRDRLFHLGREKGGGNAVSYPGFSLGNPRPIASVRPSARWPALFIAVTTRWPQMETTTVASLSLSLSPPTIDPFYDRLDTARQTSLTLRASVPCTRIARQIAGGRLCWQILTNLVVEMFINV